MTETAFGVWTRSKTVRSASLKDPDAAMLAAAGLLSAGAVLVWRLLPRGDASPLPHGPPADRQFAMDADGRTERSTHD
jgi:hypothetical protein